MELSCLCVFVYVGRCQQYTRVVRICVPSHRQFLQVSHVDTVNVMF